MAILKHCAAVLSISVAASPALPATPARAESVFGPVFSDPVWWPLREKVRIDCTHHNDCPTPHAFWGVDVVPWREHRYNDVVSHAGVYAMGAGIVHIGAAHGARCGTRRRTDFGTWVWVDHGDGVVSEYGHLANVDVEDGSQVFPSTRLGTVGDTGNAERADCGINYVDFEVRRDGVHGPTVDFSTDGYDEPDGDLLMCTPAGPDRVSEVVHRADPHSRSTSIDRMPKNTLVPESTSDCMASVPDPLW